MTGIFDHNSTLKDFSGRAAIFPLPDVVLFPHALLPLHIFEPRYRTMIDDAIKGNRLIALARLKGDYQDLYQTKHAPIYDTVCLGRITADQKLPDGRYYLVLEGVVRATILDEPDTEKPYRIGELKLHRDRNRFSEDFDPEQQAQQLLKLCKRHMGDEAGRKGFLKILESKLKLGTLCDLLSYACPIGIDQKQALLEETRIEQRSEILVRALVDLALQDQEKESFPPRFSLN
ncbi:MAG: LON peptidase substrate-binding domain-containing protein [Planctomycetaceae bacterium]|nr:LON peptidase substrate-binding domain-containing protein [Planctomycetaceae bacterium]